MQEIKAIIRPFKLDDVITALHKIEGLPGITISDIRGFGKSKPKNSDNATQEGLFDYVKMIKLEMVVHVIDVQNTIKIRTNERGEKAI
ncbi:GlnB [candidate division KSB1 bacterium 4484_87]|nr:MAG: GlnB [candidate division KSB1 bacterium 4484_87]